MRSGVISLQPLYEHVLTSPGNEQEWENPWQRGRQSEWERYKSVYAVLVNGSGIPEEPGWYLWGSYTTGIKTWKSIYVGLASNLLLRIEKEFNAEREFLYIQRYSIQQIYRFKKEKYPENYVSYNRHADRAIKKMGATFIFWVTAPENFVSDSTNLNRKLGLFESGLIDFFDPIANSDGAPLPNPPDRENPILFSACENFERLIEENRENDYSDLEPFDFIHSRFGGY